MPEHREQTFAVPRRETTAEQAQHYIDTLRDAVTVRLAAGHHPEDAMMSAWTAMESWVAVHVDGCACTLGKCPRHDKDAK